MPAAPPPPPPPPLCGGGGDGASLASIVITWLVLAPRMAPPVGSESSTLKVSLSSRFESSGRAISTCFPPVSPSAQVIVTGSASKSSPSSAVTPLAVRVTDTSPSAKKLRLTQT